jgi:hypothetical protein
VCRRRPRQRRAVGGPAGRQRRQLVQHVDRVALAGARFRVGRRPGQQGQGRSRGRRALERVRAHQGVHGLPQDRILDRLDHPARRAGAFVAAEQGDREPAGRVQVVPRIRRHPAEQDLRRQVAGSADDRADLGEPGVRAADGQAEVGEHHVDRSGPGGPHQHVGRLDVAVDQFRVVHRRQRGEHLTQHGDHGALGERAVVAQQGVQRAAGHQLTGDQHRAVLGDPAVRADDVGVIEPDGLLPHEAQQIPGVALAEELGGAERAAAAIEGAPDGARPTGTDGVAQHEAAGDHVRRHTDHPRD